MITKRFYLIIVALFAMMQNVSAENYDFFAVAPSGQTLYYKITNDSTVCVTYPGPGTWGGFSQPSGNLSIPNTVVYDDITYSVDSINTSAFIYCSNLTSVIIPNTIKAISDHAFYNCTGLTSVTIPNSVTSIGGYAFYNCTGLTSVTIPNSVTSIGSYAFSGCSGIVTVNFNATNCTSMEYGSGGVFWRCSSFENLNIADGVQTIPANAFRDCSGLSGIVIPNSVTSIGDDAFRGCSGLTGTLTIPNSVTSIGNSAFEGCTSMTSVTIGNSVSTIGGGAFSGCIELTTVNFNATNCTSMGASYSPVFWNCSSFESLNIADGVQTIPACAFKECSGLSAIIIPNSVTSIGYQAFSNCSGLTSITIPESVMTIGGNAFSGCSGMVTVNFNATNCTSMGASDSPVFWNCSSFENLNIADGVQTIPSYAFSGCNLVGDLLIPNSVVSIGEKAFRYCRNLNSLTLGTSVTSIGNCAFEGCSNLTTLNYNAISVTTDMGYHPYASTVFTVFSSCPSLNILNIGGNVQRIPKYAFAQLSGLETLTIPEAVSFIGDSAFADCGALSTVYFNATNCDTMGVIGNTSVFAADTSFTTLYIGENVQNIPDYAFYNCDRLQGTLSIPNSVMSIGKNAFNNCSGFNSVILGHSVSSIKAYAFKGCTGLSMVDYGGDIAGWLEINFASAQSNPIYYVQKLRINNSILTSLNIPNGVDTIKSYAFINDTALLSLTLNNTIVSINDSAFCSCSMIIGPIMLPENITTIGKAAFADCKGLITGVLTIPETVTYIGSSAFSGCRELTTVNFNAINCTTMGTSSNKVFSNCSSLTTLSIGNNVQTIPNYAFSDCRRLSGALDIPNSVISIGTEAFYNCDTISSINIGNSVTTIGNYAFYRCKGLPAVTIPNSVTSIGSFGFDGCSGLTNVSLGTSLANIGNYCFQGCTGLTSINIPNSVTSIGRYAFYRCSSLSSLVLGSSVSSIDNCAFNECSVLLEIHSKNPVPPTLGNSVFGGVATAIPVYIPCGRTALYSYNWSYFSNFIESPSAVLSVASADNQRGSAIVTTAPTCTSPTAVIMAYPNSGYQFDHWSNGSTANPLTLTVTEDMELIAYFSPVGSQPTTNYTITVVANDPTMGYVTGGGSYAAGSNATLTATANSGYHFTRWQDNNTSNPRTITVTTDATYTAYFESDGGGEQPSDNAPSIACVGVDMSGHNVVRWEPRQGVSVARYNIYREGLGGYSQVGYVNAGNATEYSWVDDQSNTATQAYSYKLSEVSPNGTESDLSTPHTTIHLQISQGQGTTWNLSWTPYSGFNYDGYRIYRGTSSSSMNLLTTLSASATSYSDNNAPSGNVYYQIEVVASSGAKTITATSRSNIATSVQNQTFTITVISDNNSMGTVSGGGTFAEGSTATISATPLSGYHFVRWDDGSTLAQRTITVTGNASYTAYFESGTQTQQYVITVVSNNPDRGTVSGGGLFDAGTITTITAEPFAGYEFVQWQDGNTDDFRTITVTSDATYTAYFRANNGIDDIDIEQVKVFARGNEIVVSGAGDNEVIVYDVLGRILHRGTAYNPIRVPAQGLYMVKVGEGKPQKVIANY